ncbi:MAG TPA: RnfH family protein [Gammaproteobacteria bacterium]|nr:RnfH family protein [Gammaproteobacteria bacterium]
MANNIKIEVAYATAEQQMIIPLVLPVNSTLRQAVAAAKIFSEISADLPVGIFGKLRSLDNILQDGDRVEIYRPLMIDPKVARTNRVKRERRTKREQRRKKTPVTCA